MPQAKRAERVERVAYTWFNRLVALRFMETRGTLNMCFNLLQKTLKKVPGTFGGCGAYASAPAFGAQTARMNMSAYSRARRGRSYAGCA